MTRPGNDIERYAPPPGLMRYSAELGRELAMLPEHDSWLYRFAQTQQLAEYVQHTDFVPKELKGNPPAITAVILTGAEMHLGPMASLKHIFIVRGRPSQTAEIMRAQALAAGHEIETVGEVTNTKATIRGRRRPVGEWMQVTFTADQAKFAGLALGNYPGDKLFARASSRLCRRLFADCISGIPTIEEAEDASLEDEGGTAVSALPTGATSTRRRRTSLKLETPPQGADETQREPSPSPRPTQPPLPHEEVETETTETPDPVQEPEDVPPAEEENAAIDETQREAAQPGSVNPQQLRALGATFTGKLKLGGKDHNEDRHLLTSHIIGERITTWSDLSYDQAGEVLRVTGAVKAADVEAFVRDGLNAAVLRFEADEAMANGDADDVSG